MRRSTVAALLAVVSVLGGVTTAHAAGTVFHARVGNALGLIPRHGVGRASDYAADGVIPVVYHGGSIMHGAVTIHPIFWQPAGYQFHASYPSAVQGFFSNVVADSGHVGGSASNVFSVLPQYKQGTAAGAITSGTYTLASVPLTVTDPFPTSNNCASPNGAPTCITDHQLQAEVDNVIQANGYAYGLNDLYMVFLPQDVDTCVSAAPAICATNAFGGYHSLGDEGNGTFIYANMPDPEIEGQLPGKDTFPGGDSDSGYAMDIAGHELVEAVTDPTGTGWMDPNGYEVADKCEFGPMLGTILGQAANGADYNQLINGTQYLLQEMWSNNDQNGGCVQKTVATSSPLPLPQVNLSQFSPAVSGNIGANTSGVGVDVRLYRALRQVRHVSTTTDGAGAWSLSLAPYSAGDDRDQIDVEYSNTGAPGNASILTGNGGAPLNESGWTGWGTMDTLTSALSGSPPKVYIFPCFQVGVFTITVGGNPQTPGVCDTETAFSTTPTSPPATPADAITVASNDNRAFSLDNSNSYENLSGALVNLSIGVGEMDSLPELSSLLGLTGGFPRCTGDLELGTVSCVGLVPGASYTAARTRASLSVGATADLNGDLTATLTGTPPLAGGDTVALLNSASRAVTTLHVAHLRADITGSQTVLAGGVCEPGDYYGPFTPKPTSSLSAGSSDGPALSGKICPLSGNATGLSAAAITQTDDASAGATQTQVPDVADTSPMQGETVYGPFTALADATLPAPNGATSAVTDGVAVSIAPAAGGSAVFTAANVNTATGSAVAALAPGTYAATWLLTGVNGDTRTVTTRFVEQPANAAAPGAAGSTGANGANGTNGATGPQGPRGPRGKQGPRGHAAFVTCRAVHHFIRCDVQYSKTKTRHTVHAALALRGRVAALGHAKLHRGRATVLLRPTGALHHGRMTLTLVTLGLGTTTMTVVVH